MIPRLWNPVKELKVGICTQGRGGYISISWNPVKELKGGRSPMRSGASSAPWNPVKELKGHRRGPPGPG